jgi:hypothetical protein
MPLRSADARTRDKRHRDDAQHRQAGLGTQFVGVAEHRAKLAGDERHGDAGADGGHQRQRQQRQPIRRHRLGRHAGRVDQAEVGHARGHVQFARHHGGLLAGHQVFVVLLDDRVVAVQLGGLGFDLRRRLQRSAGGGVAGGELGHPGLQGRDLHFGPGQQPIQFLAARLELAVARRSAAVAMAALRSSATSLRFWSSRSFSSLRVVETMSGCWSV